ncbi:MAG: MotA/TolQ/ExbB proton channel family protein [Planctomycetes bacterium]|nr:MotA/TolQ/ExbB proton channel family protein [Planctomycetota bacterium]
MTRKKVGLAALVTASVGALSTLASAQGDAGAAPAPSFTIAEILEDGGTIGYVIVVLSIVALGVSIDFGLNLRRARLCPRKLVEEVEALVAAGDYRETVELCEAEPNMYTNVVRAGLSKVTHDFAVIEQALEQSLEDETVKLHTKVGWLSFICSVATLLGLLGTIQGMIVAFKVIAATKGQADPSMLSDGISAALVTTLFGLCVAIPFSFVFVLFRNRVIYTSLEIGTMIEELFEHFRAERRA